ncbi:1-aminocyclopropane-1-carboxylate deaminase [Burkholderia oklahomensis C6786]|nr:1-aminocyclopropane-1-carboxylate deaminase [Burkholderia oklahomensis C6786]KUY50657.1 1-aminocyclopropane-1-carboxylate deaminase [Burkholderia oklahomensis C6786]
MDAAMPSCDETAARWWQPPSSPTLVCIVGDDTLPAACCGALANRLAGVPQVALLSCAEPARLHALWLDARSRAASRMPAEAAQVERALGRLSRDVRLLLWSQQPASLDWVGGVHGHQTFVVRHCPLTCDETELRRAADAALTLLRSAMRLRIDAEY